MLDANMETDLGSGPDRFLDPLITIEIGVVNHSQGSDV
jgi:hypothetical protein